MRDDDWKERRDFGLLPKERRTIELPTRVVNKVARTQESNDIAVAWIAFNISFLAFSASYVSYCVRSSHRAINRVDVGLVINRSGLKELIESCFSAPDRLIE